MEAACIQQFDDCSDVDAELRVGDRDVALLHGRRAGRARDPRIDGIGYVNLARFLER
jgi:hypothetical protein